jgi:predicted NACHT family NTPase
MARQNSRSLKLSTKGIEKANIALKKYASQIALALEVGSKRSKGKSKKSVSGMSRTTIGNFLNGRIVQRKEFHEICNALGLKFEEVVELPTSGTNVHSESAPANQSDAIDTLAQSIRDSIRPRVIENHGKIKVLDIENPVDLNDIYIDINILETVTGRRRLDPIKKTQENQYDEVNLSYSDLTIEISTPIYSDEVERFSYGSIKEKNVPGLNTVRDYKKLLILGRPGSGKTTFLKNLIIQCISGDFQSHCIPVFVTLKSFAETRGQPDLFEYVHQLISVVEKQDFENLLEKGRILILLDGLDEVRVTDLSRVLTDIEKISDLYFQNQFLITCRISALKHNLNLFKEVEIDDFDEEQISAFAEKWFRRINNENAANNFLEKLKSNPQIKELAKTPELLALLCLIFEKPGDFPDKRSLLYRQTIKVLNQKDIINRNNEIFYKKLSLSQKERLFRNIAYSTFDKENHLFDVDCLENIVKRFLLLEFSEFDPDQLEINKFMSIIEAHNGLIIGRAHDVYSFSHLTFHEYFVAREIVESSDRELLLIGLSQNLFKARWKEVFLLVAEMLSEPDNFFLSMKDMIDSLIIEEEKIQKVIDWAYQKSKSDDTIHEKVAIRGLYLYFLGYGQPKEIASACNLECSDFHNLDGILLLALSRARILNMQSFLDFFVELQMPNRDRTSYSKGLLQTLDAAILLTHNINFDLWSILRNLKERLLEAMVGNAECEHWWQINGKVWESELRATLVPYLGIDEQDYSFKEVQYELWIQYLGANLLLINCLNKSSNVSPIVYEEIKSTLLLPIAEIKNRQLAKRQ